MILANTDDGSCIEIVAGCTQPSAYNYDSDANQNDGSCIAVVFGCTDSEAFYNFNANTNDGTCIAVVTGCISISAINYNPLANTDDLVVLSHLWLYRVYCIKLL